MRNSEYLAEHSDATSIEFLASTFVGGDCIIATQLAFCSRKGGEQSAPPRFDSVLAASIEEQKCGALWPFSDEHSGGNMKSGSKGPGLTRVYFALAI